ncbi:MAG: hydrogenase maturation protease [Anaerolineae bacterium]|jgi:hydrogenase maturation protease
MVSGEGRGNGSFAPGASTLVVGLGNPLRADDGVGARVAQALSEQELPGDVEVVEGGTLGLDLVNLMEGRRRVILVDAAEMGRTPGEFVRFGLDEVSLLGEDHYVSVHAAGLRDALLLAQVLGALPDEIVIFGVQPASLDWRDTLSPAVEECLPHLIAAVQAEL